MGEHFHFFFPVKLEYRSRNIDDNMVEEKFLILACPCGLLKEKKTKEKEEESEKE